MAKAIQYVIELGAKEGRLFLEDILHPKADPERDAIIARAKRLHLEMR